MIAKFIIFVTYRFILFNTKFTCSQLSLLYILYLGG